MRHRLIILWILFVSCFASFYKAFFHFFHVWTIWISRRHIVNGGVIVLSLTKNRSILRERLERNIAITPFLNRRTSFLAVPQSLLFFVEVHFEVACLTVYVLELCDKHSYLLQELCDIGRFAELDGLNKSFLKLCSEDLSSFDLKDRVTNYDQISDGPLVSHVSTTI